MKGWWKWRKGRLDLHIINAYFSKSFLYGWNNGLVVLISGECDVLLVRDNVEWITFWGELHPRQTVELQHELLFEMGSKFLERPTGDVIKGDWDAERAGAEGLITI